MLRIQILPSVVLCATFAFAGCNSGPQLPPTVPAEGVVTLDGTPVSDATVTFIADVGTYNATAVTGKEGKFAMKAFEEKNGVVVGSYKVEISKTVIESLGEKGGETSVSIKYGIPVKYTTFGTSGLTISIEKSGNKEIKFDLKSK